VSADISGSLQVLRRLDSYKRELKSRLPPLPNAGLETWPLLEHDVLAIHALLDVLESENEIVAVDIGTFLGLSAFSLALHPRVLRVISVDPNPRIADELAKSKVVGELDGLDDLGDVRVLDVAREVVGSFPDEARKIEMLEGSISKIAGGPNSVIDLRDRIGDAEVIALIDGLHTAEAVEGDLNALFSACATAVALLDDCRYLWGPDVQSGVAQFLRQREHSYRFRLLADISTSFAKSNLGLVYASGDNRVEAAFAALQSAYADFDPLVMLARQEELMRVSAEDREELMLARETLRMMQESRSWKITSPLRVLDSTFQRYRS
jgi:hypothetical protein